jgi:hypothetical protein
MPGTTCIFWANLPPFSSKLGTTVWSPLAGGVLSGKYGTDQAKWKLERLAKGRKVIIMQHPCVCSIHNH